jgi:1-acyl-sn-glycerol-3-phosphate acyltransferase
LITTLRAVFVAVFLFAALFGLHAVQLLSILLFPFSRRAFRAVNRAMANAWWGLCVQLMERFHKVEVFITGDVVPSREEAVLISNHSSMVDIPAIFSLALRKGRLGDLKWMVKDVLKWVPGIGWGMVFLGCIFLKREWAKDREHVRATFSLLRDESIPSWLICFPEGTRMTPPKLQKSQAYAANAGIRVPNNLMVPRTKGFAASVTGLRGHAAAVYDVTIAYPDGVPGITDLISGTVRSFHLHVRRHPLEVLPDDNEGLSVWLHERFVEKDDLLDAFKAEGRFPGDDVKTPLPWW